MLPPASRRLLALLLPERGRWALVGVLMAAAALDPNFGSSTPGFGVLAHNQGGEVAGPYFTGHVADRVTREEDAWAAVWPLVALGLGSALAELGCDGAATAALTRARGRLQSGAVAAVLRGDVTGPGGVLGDTPGAVAARVTGDAAAAHGALADELVPALWALARAGALLAVMGSLAPLLALGTLLLLPLLLLLPRRVAATQQELARRAQLALAGATAVALESLGALGTVRAFGYEAGVTARVQQRLSHGHRLESREALAYGVARWASGFPTLVLKLGLLLGGGHLVALGTMTPGELVTILMCHLQFTRAVEVRSVSPLCPQPIPNVSPTCPPCVPSMSPMCPYPVPNPIIPHVTVLPCPPLMSPCPHTLPTTPVSPCPQSLLLHLPVLAKAVGSSETLLELLDEAKKVTALGTPSPVTPGDQGGSSTPGLCLKDVTVTYPGRAEPILKGVSLSVRPGELVAVLAPPGGGKSSLALAALGVRPLAAGAVLLDGTPLGPHADPALRRQVAGVPQSPSLLSRSLRANITLGWGHGEGTQVTQVTRVMAAAQRVGVHAWATRLPHGYDTEVGPRGMKLSGGQAQGVALARALLRTPRLLVLDEPTRALDPVTRSKVEQELLRPGGPGAGEGPAVLLVTGQVALARRAPRVALLEGGRLRELGGPGELGTPPWDTAGDSGDTGDGDSGDTGDGERDSRDTRDTGDTRDKDTGDGDAGDK
ncbi:antigen peptide transporter 1-like [Empidonax traillii]|uniref:antigen peptide transporter 1-like n=1 Tax=Empidonax traillii TaxID=164674 RepID=UPI000FFD8829|nr:antigen peptide transporter 1-like [Empidonax traillii]